MTRSSKASTRSRAAAEPRLSRTRQPESMSAEDWQAGLRRQFGREQSFVLERPGPEMEFVVHNPTSKGRYRVALRGMEPGDNFCSCPDFASNDLGTCKHIEFTLARLLARRGGKALLGARLRDRRTVEIYLSYRGERSLRFRAGTECPPALAKKGAALVRRPCRRRHGHRRLPARRREGRP